MKKIQFWSLLLGLTFGALALTACGDDDDSNPSPAPAPTGEPTELSGTWECTFTGADGTVKSEKLTFGDGNTFEAWTKEGRPHYGAEGETVHVYENQYKGEYKPVKDGLATVIIKECYSTKLDAMGYPTEGMEKVEMEKNDTTDFKYFSYGNGIVAFSRLGHLFFYTHNGEARQLPSIAGNELVGTWKCVVQYPNNGDFVKTVKINADGTTLERNMQWDGNNEREIQGMETTGFFVALPSDFLDIGKRDGVPAGAKFFTIIDTSYRNYAIDVSMGGDAKWTDTRAGSGGHPLQYVFKGGKLYYGTIGMNEEYFYSEGYTKQ